ncbi:MAG: acetylglutamate kinase [Deltaproteobacteria bacterium]|nr:acetylglutamate kinase [Deltaproteobacteria bacterium]
MKELIDKARVLIEALPYIRKFRGRTIVVKVGGNAMDDVSMRAKFAEDLILLRWVGLNVIVVHGGGPQIKELLSRLGLPSIMAHGMRVTDEPTMEAVEMVLGGRVNKELVRLINQKGGRAVGLTGKDGGLALAQKIEKLGPDGIDPGLVGEVIQVDATVLERLAGEFIPVIAPIAVDAEGRTLNVNADPFAARLAVALHAEKLVLLTDVEGVKDREGALIPSLTMARARELIAAGVIVGGMIPKVEYALESLASGVRKVHIVDGRVEHALLLEVFTDGGVGTELIQ